MKGMVWFVVGLPACAAAAGELAPNRWVQAEAGGGGVRRGAAVVWLARERRFLVLGGATGNARKGIDVPFEVQTFDPASRAWRDVRPPAVKLDGFKKARPGELLVRNEQGQRRLNPRFVPGGRSAYDAAARRVYLFQPANRARPGELLIAAYDVEARTWQVVSRTRPPADANGVLSGEFGWTVVFMEGVSPVLDAVNGEVLFLGGRTGNASDGFVGHWAFDLAKKAWRRLESPSAALDGPRARCLAARTAARDALAAARNAFYAAADKAGAVGLVRRAAERTDQAAEAVAAARADGWQARAIAGARQRLGEAAGDLRAAGERLAAGAVDAAALKRLSGAAWRLDVAADLLRAAPGPRMHAAVGYDPHRRCVVLFGGDHGDYLMSDTWVYDCPRRTWRRILAGTAPAPRRAGGAMAWLPGRKQLALVGGESYVAEFMYHRRRPRRLADVWAFDAQAERWSLIAPGDPNVPAPALTCQRAAGAGDVICGLSSTGRYRSQWDGTTWLFRPSGQAGAAAMEKAGVPAGRRAYLSVVEAYDPCWYDAAGAGDRRQAAAWLAGLKPNTWTAVPLAPRPAPQRDWGTAAFDPHRDQFYHWTGGHMADPASIVSTYHVAAGRWSIPYVAEYFGKGIGFNGRPDCMNHTYLNYAYDTASRKLVCTSLAATSLYDPDRREFERPIAQPFRQHPYYTKTVSTPRGVVCWSRGYWGVLDAAGRTWRRLAVRGKLPRVVHGDENALTYDPKRDVIWLLAADGYEKPNGQVWRYEMKTGRARPMDPAAAATLGRQVRPRESIYLPTADLVLHNAFAAGGQIAYDPAANRWVTLPIARTHKDLGSVSIGLMYDAARHLAWAMSSGQRMFVLRVEAAALRPAGRAGG